MTAKQEATENMLIEIDLYGDENATVLNSNPAIAGLRARLKDVLARIATQRNKQNTPSQGVTANKDAARLSLISTFLHYCGDVYAYGVAQGNNEIKEAADFKSSRLGKLSAGDLVSKSQILADLMVTHADALETNYGITMLMITEFSDKINAFDALRGKPEEARDHIEVATDELENLIKQGRELLSDEYDRLMQRFKSINPVLYNHYIVSRKIDDPKTNPTKFKGTVKDVDGNPIAGVTISFVNDLSSGSVVTNADGAFDVKAKNGYYSITATKPGFHDFALDSFRIKLGQVNHLNIEMTAA